MDSTVDSYEPAASIFAEREPHVTGLPQWMSLSAVAVAMALGVTLYVVIAGSRDTASVTTKAAPDRPIELVELHHRSAPATALEVSGLVRNPANGRGLTQLVAVVNLLDADGRIVTSQTTPVEEPVLEAGRTAAFSVVFPRVSESVARYQVEFRLDGHGILHVDRRAPEREAKSSSS